MSKIRASRLGEQIKKDLGMIIQKEMKDPRVGFITITGVDVTNDLSQAKVYLSIMGDEEKKSESLLALEKAKGYLRSEIGKRIKTRHIPELIFKVDESIEYGSKIEHLIAQLNREREE